MPTAVARFFDSTADAYDVLEPWYEHLYQRLHGILRAELAPAADQLRPRALDAGCGTGFQTALLAELGYRTHGADLAEGLLARARRRVGRVAWARADLEALPYRDESFAVVTSCGSTLDFVARPARALAEIGRVLRPRGRLLLEVEHKWSLDLGWALVSSLTGDALGYGLSPGRIWRQLARPLGQGFWLEYPGYPPLRLFTRGELHTMLAAAGLAPVRTWGIHVATNLIPSTVLHRPRLGPALGRLYRRLCAIDGALGRFRPAHCLANSLIVLAWKPAGTGAPVGVTA